MKRSDMFRSVEQENVNRLFYIKCFLDILKENVATKKCNNLYALKVDLLGPMEGSKKTCFLKASTYLPDERKPHSAQDLRQRLKQRLELQAKLFSYLILISKEI